MPSNKVAQKDWLNGLYHPAVVWDDSYDGNSDFHGIMLTHSVPNSRFENILLADNHFQAGYEIGSTGSHFVNQIFIKFLTWGHFRLVGKLTEDGINFIESTLTNRNPIDFIRYRDSIQY